MGLIGERLERVGRVVQKWPLGVISSGPNCQLMSLAIGPITREAGSDVHLQHRRRIWITSATRMTDTRDASLHYGICASAITVPHPSEFRLSLVHSQFRSFCTYKPAGSSNRPPGGFGVRRKAKEQDQVRMRLEDTRKLGSGPGLTATSHTFIVTFPFLTCRRLNATVGTTSSDH